MAESALLRALDLSKQRAIELVTPLLPDEPYASFSNDQDDLLNRFALVCWSNIVEPGDRIARELVSSFGEQGSLVRVAKAALEGKTIDISNHHSGSQLKQQEVDAAVQRWSPRFSVLQFRRSFEWSSRLGLSIITDRDSVWPEGLSDLQFHAPLLLYKLGVKTFDNSRKSVALVGSRAISPYGRWVTKDFCEALVGEGVTVISGGAFGVDAVAHESTLALGGETVAVMAGGLDRFYPYGNTPLLNEIKNRGVICSEVPPGFTPTKWRFLQRNRIIAAMTQATIVVEAGYRSGSINTANHAATLARNVGAVPGAISSASSAGCHELINDGKATLVANPKHLLRLIDSRPEPLEAQSRLSDEQIRVLDAIGMRSSTENTIAIRSGMSLLQCQMTLATLEIEGLAGRKNLKWQRLSRSV